MDKEKISFIEEAKIKREVEATPKTSAHTNPIKAKLMKFVHMKLGRSENFKKDF